MTLGKRSKGYGDYGSPLLPEHPSFVEIEGDKAEDLAENVSTMVDSILLTGEIPLETSVLKEYKLVGLSLDLYPSPYLVQEMNADSLNRRYDVVDISISFQPETVPEVNIRFYNSTVDKNKKSLLTEPLLLASDGDGYVFYFESSAKDSEQASPDGVKKYSLSDVVSLLESILTSDLVETNPANTKLNNKERLIIAIARLKNDSRKFTTHDSYKHAWQDDVDMPPFSCVQVQQIVEKKAFMLVDEKEITTVTSTRLEYFKPEADVPEYRVVIAYVYTFEKDESGDINYSSSTIDVYSADDEEELPQSVKTKILGFLTRSEFSADDFRSIIVSAITDTFTPIGNRDLGDNPTNQLHKLLSNLLLPNDSTS